MPTSTRLRRSLSRAVCLVGLAAGVPAIATALAPEPAEARAGGSYGSSSSSSSSSRSSSSGFRSSGSTYSSSRYRHGGSGGGISFGEWLVILGVLGGLIFFSGTSLFGLRRQPSNAVLAHRPRQWETLTVLQAEMAEHDPAWEEANLLEQARESYMAVQHAWVRRDQDLAKSEMTPELYARHKAQTDAMIARGEVAVLQHLEITGCRLVHASDYQDDSRDEAWIKISARAFDYLMSEHTGRVLKGRKDEVSVFSEIWKFRRDGANWVAAEIVPNADIHVPQSYRQAVSA
ncbi:MAG: Tim44 domain-containing protein [Candidatus Sericytochromatia bacterium]